MSYKQVLQTAYILHTIRYRDSSLIVELLTRDHGRVSLIAKGVRREKSRQRAFLQYFKKVKVSWQGKGDLYTLTHVEEFPYSVSTHPNLSGEALYCGFYLNELLIKLIVKHDPVSELFELYDQTLVKMGTDKSRSLVLRIFEKKLLQLLGYGLALEFEADTGKKVKDNKLYRYIIETGPVSSHNHELLSDVLIHGSSMIALVNEQINDKRSLRECRNLMRRVIDFYLGNKKIKSRDLLVNEY